MGSTVPDRDEETQPYRKISLIGFQVISKNFALMPTK
jgi:hypothetical protein